ncbi:transcription factor bHLH155-like isoform X2 [Phoenix dactylifera]|uniref:Transcription factor bHLH155-like isoform X2 n=1 Tax=Phoenix dactylifera TaxID=42345 RepID=A0A8B7CUY7_PHODC|nr:transcription factor bHLH155-like isoform X2 [Phoenix dactylifera]
MALAPQPRGVLGGLCTGGVWSYGVLWRVDRCDPRLLMVEDCYFEERVQGVLDKILNQVHMVGEGIIGGAVISGKHQWIYSDIYGIDLSPTNSTDNPDVFQSNAEWQHQFTAGIKTIVIISLPSLGVAQFGSPEKIPENLEFVNQVKHSLEQVENIVGLLPHGVAHKALTTHDENAASASANSSGTACNCYDNTNSLHGDIREKCMTNTEPLRGPVQFPSIFSQGSFHGFTSHSGSMNPIVSMLGVAVSESSCDRFQKIPSVSRNSSFHRANQYPAASAEAQVLLYPNIQFQSDSYFPNDSVATNLNAYTWAKGIADLAVEQRLLSGMGMQGFSSLFPTSSYLSVPQVNALRQVYGDSSSSCSTYRSCDTVPGSRSSEISKTCTNGAEKLLELRHSSLSSLTVGGLSGAKSFCPELADTFVTLQDMTTENSPLLHSENDSLNDLNHLNDQPPERASDRSVKMNETPLGASSVSACLAELDGSGCTPVTGLQIMPVKNSTAAQLNSMGTGNGGKESSSITPTQPLSHNDLFDGMELDLSPSILVQECWDDIIMPVGSGSCSNLSANVSECISELDMGSTAGAEKGLFSDSGLEQLLDAIVGESGNKASTHNSAAINVDPIASLDSKHKFSTSTRVEKIMHGSPKEPLSKSRVSSWIDDSCSMNAGSAMINQPKKPEEAVKVVKKRARPGESTRPRPKDRQQIQDRVKELREIVPNGAKCSIDALLDRTIKHMLFLQSVTKYADKIKQADEPKMIGEESGVVLKDNSNGGSSGGATWAYEVAGQTMVCPIIVEDLTPPGQMLVEMLCEERGFFLEIADIIRGFGLTILKGVMEIHDSKIWARFLVEANRGVTRMDIFLSLVQLLQQTSSARSSDQPAKVIDKGAPTFTNYQQSPVSIPISLEDRLH